MDLLIGFGNESGGMGPKLGPFPTGNIVDVVCVGHLCLCTA